MLAQRIKTEDREKRGLTGILKAGTQKKAAHVIEEAAQLLLGDLEVLPHELAHPQIMRSFEKISSVLVLEQFVVSFHHATPNCGVQIAEQKAVLGFVDGRGSVRAQQRQPLVEKRQRREGRSCGSGRHRGWCPL